MADVSERDLLTSEGVQKALRHADNHAETVGLTDEELSDVQAAYGYKPAEQQTVGAGVLVSAEVAQVALGAVREAAGRALQRHRDSALQRHRDSAPAPTSSVDAAFAIQEEASALQPLEQAEEALVAALSAPLAAAHTSAVRQAVLVELDRWRMTNGPYAGHVYLDNWGWADFAEAVAQRVANANTGVPKEDDVRA